MPPASPYAVAGGWSGTTGFSESASSYTANHVQLMEQLCPDPNGVGACRRPALPGLRPLRLVRGEPPTRWRGSFPPCQGDTSGPLLVWVRDSYIWRVAGCAASTGPCSSLCTYAPIPIDKLYFIRYHLIRTEFIQSNGGTGPMKLRQPSAALAG